jgi:CelD/BcsL family acetyltransferase involved in cellulose biosynthesis
VRPVDACLWVQLDESWQEPEQHLEPDVRRNLARRRRRAAEVGPIHYELIRPLPSQLDEILNEAFRIEAASWKGRQGTALAQDSRRGRFFRAYAARAAHDGDLRIGFLCLGDERVAMHLGIERDGCFWALKMGYDEQYSRLSPGRLIACEALRDSAERGLHGFEMLGVVEGWKREWTSLEHSCVSVRAYPWNPRSAKLLMNDVVSWSWRHFVRGRVRRIAAAVPVEQGPGSAH